MKFKDSKRARGYALITSVLFLMVLAIIAVTAMRMTTMDMRMTTNTTLAKHAFQNSKSGRAIILNPLEEHIFSRGWPQKINGEVNNENFTQAIPTGLAILDKDENGAPDILYEGNSTGEDLYSLPDNLVNDLSYRLDGNNDNDYADPEDIDSTAAVYRTRVTQNSGSAIAGSSGYLGVGYGLAAGGGSLYLELRGRGQAAVDTSAITASEYRHIIRN